MRPTYRAVLVALVSAGALAAGTAAIVAEPSSRAFIVDGLALGAAVYPESPVYRAYTCRPSQEFPGFTWCAHHSERSGKFGHFTSCVSLLHSNSNRVVFITETVVPAFFAQGDVDREIARISKGFGQEARTLTADVKPGLPHAILVAWGDVTLTPLDETALDALRRGEEIHRGLIADFLGDARKSARSGPPVFSLGGGPGFLWGASFDDAGNGSLRSSAVDDNEVGAVGNSSIVSVAPTNRPKPPIVSPYAPSLTINNNSCRSIATVLIDGATQLHGIGPGDAGQFHMDKRCSHTVQGVSEEIKWNADIRCEGLPYDNYTLNWMYTGPPVTSAVPEESLIVETRSNDNYGQIQITSKLDCVTVQKLVANRGNCKVGEAEPDRVLKFGETVSIPYFCSTLIELNISTDQGDSTFNWEK
jgi:hypothetical protein